MIKTTVALVKEKSNVNIIKNHVLYSNENYYFGQVKINNKYTKNYIGPS